VLVALALEVVPETVVWVVMVVVLVTVVWGTELPMADVSAAVAEDTIATLGAEKTAEEEETTDEHFFLEVTKEEMAEAEAEAALVQGFLVEVVATTARAVLLADLVQDFLLDDEAIMTDADADDATGATEAEETERADEVETA
jgi:hypothetical protein